MQKSMKKPLKIVPKFIKNRVENVYENERKIFNDFFWFLVDFGGHLGTRNGPKSTPKTSLERKCVWGATWEVIFNEF